MKGTPLPGLAGTNPLGFLAALGVQVVLLEAGTQSDLWWKPGVSPTAMVSENVEAYNIAEQAMEVFARWCSSPALTLDDLPNIPRAKADTLKLAKAEIRTYLDRSRETSEGAQLSAALVAEGSLDNQGAAKRSVLYSRQSGVSGDGTPNPQRCYGRGCYRGFGGSLELSKPPPITDVGCHR